MTRLSILFINLYSGLQKEAFPEQVHPPYGTNAIIHAFYFFAIKKMYNMELNLYKFFKETDKFKMRSRS